MLREILLCVALQLALACLVTAQGIEPRSNANIGGRNYYFSPIAATSRDARKVCQDMNFELASFETESEFLQVTFYMTTESLTLPHYTSGVIIGNDWVWSSTGQVLAYGNRWDVGEPNDGTTTAQACLLVIDGYLNDIAGCTAQQRFICEQRDC